MQSSVRSFRKLELSDQKVILGVGEDEWLED
jgi:hypothetical protein